jgi:two-component system chemotaxis sensor kinase CheA
MDASDYLPMFLAEGREHLQALNLSLVEIEQNPRDAETMNAIFRAAHTLKGMSATMGFQRMASLTHEMESVMEGMRTRADGLGRDALDALFACLDTLERMVEEIEEGGAETSDPAVLVTKLKGLLAAPAAEPVVVASGGGPDAEILAANADAGLPVLRIAMTLAAGVDMPSVRAFLAVRRVEEHGDVIHSEPAVEVIERGELESETIVLWLTSTDDADVVRATVLEAEGIGACHVADAGADAPAPAAGPAPDAEDHPAEAAPAIAAPVVAVPEAPAAEVPAAAEPAAPGRDASAHAKRKHGSATVRVEAERLDLLMHMMGEMVVQRTRLESLAQAAGAPDLQAAVNDLSRVAQSLQQMVMQVRMVPVESVFMRFPRMVRDIASKMGKHVDLQIKGEETELDRTVVEALGDPLVHLVRNAMDHGLEPPDERTAAGKAPTGTLEIAAEHAGGEVVIRVREDGRGVNPENVGKIAVKRGILTPEQAAALSIEDAIELLFAPGFSTAAATTDISGRGVGMDAVRTMVRNLGGDCSLTSVPGHGSAATIRLPLSLAILPALLVEVDGSPYALPLERVEQTIRLSDYALRSIAGAHAIVLRDRILPLHDLSGLVGGPTIDLTNASAVVVRAGQHRVGLVVQELIGQQELVTRPLPSVTDRQRAIVSGGAVLGNGRIALIVDLDALGKQVKAA